MNLKALEQSLRTLSELDVACPYCGRAAGVPCAGRQTNIPPHSDRRRVMALKRAELQRLIEWEYRCLPALRAPEGSPSLAGGSR